MTVRDLWRDRHGQPTRRDGRGLRYRVTVAGYPSTSHRTRAEAERVNAQRITAGPPQPESTMTVGEALDVVRRRKAGLSSERSAAQTITAVRAEWGDVPLVDVTETTVQTWVDDMTSLAPVARPTGRPRVVRPASASTRIKRLQVLRQALAVGVRAGAIPHDPTGEVTVPDVERREPRPLTMPELARLAAASSDPVTIWVMGTTGVRSGEAAALDVGDVVRRRGGTRLRVRRSKNGTARDVPVSKSVLAMLDLDRPASAPLLTSPTGGRLRMDNWRARVFDPAVAACGLGPRTPHDLRHTAVSLAIAAGADIKTVQRFAGHKTAAMTVDVYGHLMDDALDDVARRMGKAIKALRT